MIMLDRLKAQGDLCAALESESAKHNLPQAVITNFERLNLDEEIHIKEQCFDEDLKFSAPVNLRDSKKAFLSLLSNLDEEEKLFMPFVPQRDLSHLASHPLEKIEPSFLESIKRIENT